MYIHCRRSLSAVAAPVDGAKCSIVASAVHVKRKKVVPAAEKSKALLKLLLSGLQSGVVSAAGWLAAAELRLMEAASSTSPAQESLEQAAYAAGQGLQIATQNNLAGTERMQQASSLLQLALARAHLGLGDLDAAQGVLTTLARGAGDAGTAEAAGAGGQLTPFSAIAGMPAVDVQSQCTRYLAMFFIKRGLRPVAVNMYAGLVAGAGSSQEAWAHAEYGALKLADGEAEASKMYAGLVAGAGSSQEALNHAE
eukprot:gene28096-31204_t